MLQIDNYHTDYRVIAANTTKWYRELNESNMKALFIDPDTNEEIWVNFEWDICQTCGGRGVHVNPSIDCNGITMEEFAEDPYFYEEYRNRSFDVVCYECKGKRVVPVCDDERVNKWRQEEVDCQSIYAAEKRMGA